MRRNRSGLRRRRGSFEIEVMSPQGRCESAQSPSQAPESSVEGQIDKEWGKTTAAFINLNVKCGAVARAVCTLHKKKIIIPIASNTKHSHSVAMLVL